MSNNRRAKSNCARADSNYVPGGSKHCRAGSARARARSYRPVWRLITRTCGVIQLACGLSDDALHTDSRISARTGSPPGARSSRETPIRRRCLSMQLPPAGTPASRDLRSHHSLHGPPGFQTPVPRRCSRRSSRIGSTKDPRNLANAWSGASGGSGKPARFANARSCAGRDASFQ
jgi:hypothetical protein